MYMRTNILPRCKQKTRWNNMYGRKSSKNFTAGISGPHVEAVALTQHWEQDTHTARQGCPNCARNKVERRKSTLVAWRMVVGGGYKSTPKVLLEEQVLRNNPNEQPVHWLKTEGSETVLVLRVWLTVDTMYLGKLREILSYLLWGTKECWNTP